MSDITGVRVLRPESNDPIPSIVDAKRMEKSQSMENPYYSVILKNEATESLVRVRTSVFFLDADRRPVLVDGQPQQKNPHDVALDVWAAYGAEEHTLEMVMRGALVVATPASIATELAARSLAASRAA